MACCLIIDHQHIGRRIITLELLNYAPQEVENILASEAIDPTETHGKHDYKR